MRHIFACLTTMPVHTLSENAVSVMFCFIVKCRFNHRHSYQQDGCLQQLPRQRSYRVTLLPAAMLPGCYSSAVGHQQGQIDRWWLSFRRQMMAVTQWGCWPSKRQKTPDLLPCFRWKLGTPSALRHTAAAAASSSRPWNQRPLWPSRPAASAAAARMTPEVPLPALPSGCPSKRTISRPSGSTQRSWVTGSLHWMSVVGKQYQAALK